MSTEQNQKYDTGSLPEITLSTSKAYARQIIKEGKISNYDLFSSACIELKRRTNDPEALELLTQLLKLENRLPKERYHSGIFFFGAIFLFVIGLATIFLPWTHFVWVGAFIISISLLFTGIKVSEHNRELDRLSKLHKQRLQSLDEKSGDVVKVEKINESVKTELDILTKEWIILRDKFTHHDDNAIFRIVEIENQLKNQYNIANPIKWLTAKESEWKGLSTKH